MPHKYAITPDQLKVFETVPDLYIILSPDLHILTASDAYLSAAHTVRNEIVGKYVFDVFPENTSSAEANAVVNLKASLSEVLAIGKSHKMALQRYDILGLEKNGEFEERYWHILNTPVLDSQGNVSYIRQKVSDETQHIKNHQYIRELTIREQAAQHEAERQQQLLHLLYMEAPAPIVILEGKNFVYQLINPAYQKIFPGRELLGKPILEALPELKETIIPDLLEKVYQTGEFYVAYEMPLMMARYEGDSLEEMFWNFTYQARFDQHGNIDGVLVYAYEVTEQVLARKKLEKGQEELKQFKFMADQAQDPFILMREDGLLPISIKKPWRRGAIQKKKLITFTFLM